MKQYVDTQRAQEWTVRVPHEDAPRIPKRKGRGPWWQAPAQRPRAGGGRYGDIRGYGKFFADGPRQQRVATPVRVRLSSGARWATHGAYLERAGAQRAERGQGFDMQGDAPASLADTLKAWQREGDPHFFQIVLSPENAKGANLQAFTRTVMKAVAKDLGRPLEWIAVDHYNTAHPHVHLAIRGGGREPLTIAKAYLWGGLSKRAGEVLTQELGWRLEPELEQQRQRAVERHRFGEHDKSLLWKLDERGRVQEQDLGKWEVQRLRKLEERGLAWKQDGVWELAYRWKEKMQMAEREERTPKEQQREREEPQQERGQEREPDTARHEQQRRLVRIIDDERERSR